MEKILPSLHLSSSAGVHLPRNQCQGKLSILSCLHYFEVLLTVFSSISGLFTGSCWQSLQNLSNPHLVVLARDLPGIILCDRAPSTVLKYWNSFQRWCTWARSFGLSALPASGIHLALYLCDLMKKCSSPGPILSSLYGVSWAHRKALVADPGNHPLVRQVCESAKRLLGHSVTKKKHLTTCNVRAIVDRFAQPGADLSDLQTTLLIVVGFAGFLRWNDLSNIRVESITFFELHMSIFLDKRKNDQFHNGSVVNVTRSGLDSCPVCLTERFLARTGMSSGPLFREIEGRGSAGRVSSRSLRYATARSQALKAYAAVGLDPKEYGLHSLRSGGASAASLAGIPDRLISSHGGWKSESSRNRYIRDDRETLLSVSKALEI